MSSNGNEYEYSELKHAMQAAFYNEANSNKARENFVAFAWFSLFTKLCDVRVQQQ